MQDIAHLKEELRTKDALLAQQAALLQKWSVLLTQLRDKAVVQVQVGVASPRPWKPDAASAGGEQATQ